MPDPWDSKTVIGLFCDPYVANTNLEGGHSEETLSDVSGWLRDLKGSNPKAAKVLQEASHLFEEGARLGNEGRGAFGSPAGAASWCVALRKALEALKQGDMLLAPGGWIHNKGGHAILYLFQRIRGNEFAFAVCNTGEGVNDHPQDAGAAVFPKEKHITSWRLTGIPSERILDELWLHSLFKIYFTKADHHKPAMLYEVLLPMLLPNGDVRKQTDESWQTSATLQRAGSCYYKCIPAALRLILGTRGIEAPERKRLMYQLRVQQLQRIHGALGSTDLEGLSRSDLMVVEFACRQVAQKVLREERVGLPAKDMEAVRDLIAAVDSKVGEAHQAQREAMAARAVGISEGANPANVGYVGFPGWEALSISWAGKGNNNYRAYSHLMGDKDTQRLGEHVDLASLRQLSGIELLRTVRTMCDCLERNGLEETSKLRIGALIEDVFLCQFQPDNQGWMDMEFDLALQKEILQILWQLAQHYVSAVASSTTAPNQVAAQVLTMRCLHVAYETILRRAASDGMLPTTQAILAPGGGDDVDAYRNMWSFGGDADLRGRGVASATECLPLSTPHLAEARDALQRHPLGGGASGDSAWDVSLCALKFDARALNSTQQLVTDLVKKVLRIPGSELPPGHSEDWPKWTVPFGWALNGSGPIRQKAPEFYWWRDLVVWCKYICLDPKCRQFKGVWNAKDAQIRWSIGYCQPCEILKAQIGAFNIKFDMLSKGFVAASGADLNAAGLKGANSEDDVIHAPTLPDFGKAFAQEEAEHVLSSLTVPYLRVPLLLHFLAADRLHALKQTSVQQLLWAAMLEPATWVDDRNPPPVEQAPERGSKLGAAFGLLHNEVEKGLGAIAHPFCALLDQAEELASLAPPEEFDGPPADILLFFVRLCSRFLDQIFYQKDSDKYRDPDLNMLIDTHDDEGKKVQIELCRHLTNFLEKKATKHLQRYIEQSSQEVDVRCKMHAHLALTCFHRDVSIPQNMVVLLSSCAYVLSWYERDFHEDFGTELQMVFEVVQRRRCEVISALQAAGGGLKKILDEVAKITSNFFAGGTDWKEDGTGAYRCQKDRGGAAVFNAQTCTLWLESGLLRPIPPKLQRLPQFAEFFRQHPVKLQPTCRPMRLATNCHILSAVDDDGITLEMQWWSETKRGGPRVESEDSSGYHWKEASGHGRAPQAVGFPWEEDGGWVMPGGVRCESNDVSGWLRGLGKDTLADIWDTLLRFAEEPGNDDEGDALACIQGRWYVQTNHTGSAKELVAIQCEERLGIVEARFACEQHPVIRIFALSEWGRHAFRSQIFCSNAALSYAALIPNAKPRKVPLCNPQFAGRIGFLPSMESMALFDDGKRLWVPPVALQGLLPAVLTEGCRFWGICDGDGAVSFVGEPFNPPIYSSLTYSLKVTCQHGVARVTRKVGDKIWVLASPIHAPTGSQIARFANILAPLEAMSHALFWTSEDGQSLTLVELPRVQLRFAPGPDPGGRGLRLFSKEFGGFYLLDRNGVHDAEAWQAATGDPRASDLASYLAKMPHAVVLRSTAGAIRILVTNADVVRPAIKVKPFSTDLVVNRKLLVALGLKTFLWDFHESGSLLLTSSLSGTLYLTLLTLLHRDYSSAARLVGSIGFDEGISADEERLLIFNLKSTVTDRHPNASAIRLKLLLALIAHNPKHFLLKPEEELIAGDYADYLVKLNHVSQHCRLLLREEGSLLRNMTDMGADFWPQAVNRKRFVEACLNDSSACVLTYGDSHPGGRREGFLGYQSLSGVMSSYVKNKWYENFTVDEAEAGKSRQDLASLIELMDRFDREDWTCSGTLFFTLYGILTGVSHTKLNGKDVAQTVARLALEKFWLRMVRLCKNPSGDDCRTIRTLWSVMGMHSLGTASMLPSFAEAVKLYKESKYGCLIGHDEKGGLIWLNKLNAALEQDGGYSSAEALTAAVSCQSNSKTDRLSISEESMPKFLPAPAPRLLDFARRSASLEGQGREVLAMLGQPMKTISDSFVCDFEESVSVPENPFTTERLKSLPGGMTRIAGDIIKGKLDGHAVYLDQASKRKGCGLKCLPQDLASGHLEPALGTLDELESEVKTSWSKDLQQVVSMRTEMLETADKAPADQGDGTRFWLQRRGGIEGHLWLEWCVGAELDNERFFEGCIAAVNKVSNTASAQLVGQRMLGMMLYVCRIAQAQLALGSLQDLRSAIRRAEKTGVDEVVSKELQTLAGRLAVFLGCKRNYTNADGSTDISPAFLLFEYVTGFLVRKQQVTLIQTFAKEAFEGRSLVAQMIMGAGKTTCIAPMLTLLLGNDGRLVLNIVPKALLAQTRNVMRKMFGQILAKRVVTLEFSRMMGQDDPFDVQLIKQQLFDAQRDAAVVCTTPAAIKSMFLRHLELLQLNHLHMNTQKKYKAEMHKAKDSVSQTRLKKRMQDVNKEVEGNRVMAGFIGDVLAMLRQNSCALIDEVDLVLHPLKSELNFPIGNFEMYDLGCERWNLAVHLLDALFLNDEGHAAAGTFYPEIRNCIGKAGDAAAARISQLEEEIPNIVREGYDALTLQKQPHLVLLSRPWYDEKLRRPLAEWLACWIVTRPEAEKFRQAVEFKDVCDFLSMDLAELLKSSCKARVEVKADGILGKLLTLGREWLFSLVPHVISKIDRVQYGLLTEQELQQPENQKAPSSRRLLAVPFVAKDKPSPAAEFAQPDVLIGFTVLAYRYEGLRLSDTVQMLHHLQMKSGRESGPWSSRPTCVLFERWKDLGGKRYEEKGGKSSAGGLEPLTWEVHLDDEWKKLPNSITEKLREAVALKQTKIRFKGFGAQPYEIDLEAMVQVNLKSHKKRDIRQVESSAKRGDDLKLPELQALSSSTGDEESKKEKKKKEAEDKPEGDAGDAALAGGTVQEKKPEGHAQVAMELLGPVPEIVLWYLLTMVFDAVLRQQPYKLSATGQELGSSMLFSSRIGFSGTPSSLLPEDLGTCLFEAENEGEILSVLSDEQHVVPPLIEMAADWSPESILSTVAKSKDPVYHCLIDTGALVMGFTNDEVAKVLLKMLPEELFDGVAYFDDRDAPMVILRGAVKPALLSEAGVPMDRRFTFFDQVHTTGTDTKQPLQSYAALTLSASMTFRDYAQGAWRMRGLGKGQKLRMIITPELAKKVQGAVKAEGTLGLHDAVAFMLSNQFDSEGKQFAALQLQNLATVWRKHSLNNLMAEQEPKNREELRAEVESFLESLRFPVEPKVREPLRLHEKMQEMVNAQAHIMTADEKDACAKLIDAAAGGGGGEGGELGAEITRQQEKEQEKQQEKEKEVEVHVGREREREVEWPLKALGDSDLSEQVFFKLSNFKMSGLKTRLKCSGSALISSNHTANDLSSLTARRMKSVILLFVLPHSSGTKTIAVSMAEAAALRRASHLSSEHLQTASLWVSSGSKKVPESSQNLLSGEGSYGSPESGVLKALRLEAARLLLRFFNCELDFRPEEVTSTVKAIESGGSAPKQRQHFVETVLTARRREACAWRDTPLGEIVRGDSAKLEERERLAQNLFGLMSARFKSTGDFFKVLDVNGDGVIQHEEFQRSMKKIFKGAFSAEDIRKLFIAADSSGQGNVSSQDIVQLLRLGAIATGSELPGEEHGAAPNPTVDAGTTDDTPEEPASPTSPSADPGTTDGGGGGTTESSIEDLWGISAEAADRLVVKLTEQVNAMPNDRQTLFTDLSAAHEKREKDAFVQKLRELAGVATAEMPNARASMLEVVEVGRSCDSAHDVNCFQITVLANLLDDPVLHSELQDMYEAAVEGGAEPLPECLATAEKYLAKTVAVWREFPEKWAELVALSSSEDDLRKVIDFAMASQSHRLRRLALARGLRAGPAEAAAAGAVEMSTAILAEISQMKTKVTAAGDDDPIHTMVELGVFLLASLVKGARSATLPKLSGADFQEAARYVWDQKQDHPQIITALCYVLQALSLKLTKWQVQLNDAGDWADLAAERQLELRKATEKGETVIHFRARGFPYEIDLKEMTQKNLKTGTTRTIQEVEVPISTLAGDGGAEEEVEAEKPYKWQVSNGKGGWWDFPEDVDAKLKEARAAGISVVKCTIRRDQYEVDIVNMHQKNCKTGTKREIRTQEG